MLDDPRLAAAYLFPRPAPLRDPFVVDVDGAQLHGWASPRRPGAPVLLHFHGNGEVVADYLDLAPALLALGVDVVFAEYRGYGGSTGTPTAGSLLRDSLAWYDALDADRIVVYGRSVGSLPAIHVAAHRTPHALILESAIADPLERFALYVGPELVRHASPEDRALVDHRAKIEASTCPVTVLHAQHDHLVDVSHGERLAAWAGDRGRLLRLEPGDHNTVVAHHLRTILTTIAAAAQ